MRRTGILQAQLNAAISRLGHTDRFLVADAGFPVPDSAETVDLRVVYGTPRWEEVLTPILEAVVVEGATAASEMPTENRANYDLLTRAVGEVVLVPHDQLKELARQARFIVRTGEATPYSNVLLTAGVAFDV